MRIIRFFARNEAFGNGRNLLRRFAREIENLMVKPAHVPLRDIERHAV